MTAAIERNWRTCGQPECKGSVISDTLYCLAHNGEWRRLVDQELDKHRSVDLRGTVIDYGILAYILKGYSSRGIQPKIFDGILRADCDLARLKVDGDLSFVRTEFRSEGTFRGAQIFGQLTFDHVLFTETKTIGPMVAERVNIDNCQFDCRVEGVFVADNIRLLRSSFKDGCSVQVRFADIAIQGTSFGNASLISSQMATHGDRFEILGARGEKIDVAKILAPKEWQQQKSASLVSIQDLDMENLTLSGLDLSMCKIDNVHNLDKVHLEDVDFMLAPRSEFDGDDGMPKRRAHRRVLFDEAVWRYARKRRSEWAEVIRGGDDISRKQPRSAEYIASLYRRLRKALEDGKDEPGAADFYYGEMEMRRHSRKTTKGVKFLITLYWLFSGYGLRATRSLVTLILAVSVTAIIFYLFGFGHIARDAYVPVNSDAGMPAYRHVALPGPKPDFPAALLYSIESATSLIRSPQSLPLNLTGKIVEVVLRVLGPALLALTFIAMRNRLKR